MLRFLKAMMIFARYQEWVEPVQWDKDDQAALESFLRSTAGMKLSASLRNMLLRQQASSLTKTSGLEFEAGYCNGQRSVLAAIESLADPRQFTVEDMADPGSQTS